MVRLAILALVLVGLGCKNDPSGKPANKPPPEPPADPCAKAVPHGPAKWIEDDYPSALACARQRKQPLVLDLWAPWCHTCISMKTTVFADPAFGELASKFVFAALDTDREVNAEAVGKFALGAWPTFYVIGPKEEVFARFVGAATLAQFKEFVTGGELAMTGAIAVAETRLLGAERALAKKDLATAEEELAASLAAAMVAWPRRPEVIYTLMSTRSKRGNAQGCLELADRYMIEIGATAISTNFMAIGIECAKKHAAVDPERARAMQERLVERLGVILAREDAQLSVDDRAEAMGYQRDGLADLGKKDEATAVADKLRALLDDAWAKAGSPKVAMTYLWPRAEAYAYLGRPLDLVADYGKLAAELPDEYDPRARLGWLYMKAGKHVEAARWTEEALALVYGPRKGRVLAQRAEIAALAGDKATERRYRAEAVKLWESLPAGQQSPEKLEQAKALLAAVDAPAGSGAGAGGGSAGTAGAGSASAGGGTPASSKK